MTKTTNHKKLIVLALAIIALVLVSSVLKNQPSVVDQPTLTLSDNHPNTQNFDLLLPDDWPYTDTAIKDVQSLTPNQSLLFGIVPSANENGVHYFITTAPNPTVENQRLLSVYKYHDDYNFERIYRVSYGPEKGLTGIRSGTHIDLHAIGYDNNNLIILAQDADSSPGRCTEVLTLGRQADDDVYEMLSLDLSDPFRSGLQPYRVPDDTYNQALAKQNNCPIE